MTLDSRIDALRAKHTELDQQILEESGRPQPDSLAIAQLKKQKLRIKDELARLTAEAERGGS
ncbi:MAG: YdcH family protein [Alphaproteobacteria bacterium]